MICRLDQALEHWHEGPSVQAIQKVTMIPASEAIVWTNHETKEVDVTRLGSIRGRQPGWGDPIGASYAEWGEMNDAQRTQLMLQTVIDLAAHGFDILATLRAFSKIYEFRALGSQSYPMSRALTKALVGKRLEPNSMTFEELLIENAPK
jgi:hypothetical protein